MPVCLVGLVDMKPYMAAFTGVFAWQCLRLLANDSLAGLKPADQHIERNLYVRAPLQRCLCAQLEAHFCMAWACNQQAGASLLAVGLLNVCLPK